MKTIKPFLVCLLVALGFSSCATKSVATIPAQNYQDYGEVNYQTFYDELSPHGRWIMDDQYGYVWSPNAGPDFMPYSSNGHWVYTDIGWTWASDYRWGWATFHYGRWKLDNYYGWVWVPGYEWAPAWVAWSSSSDYYGWAPLEPGWNVNVSINIGRIPSNYWVFVPHRYVTYSNWNHYCAPRRNNITIINQVTVIHNTNVYNNTRFVCGPRPEEYRRCTGYAVRPVAVREYSRPRPVNVQDGSLCVYRPRVKGRGENYKPTNIVTRPRTNDRPHTDNGNHYGNDPRRPGNGNDKGTPDNGGPKGRPDSDNNGRYADRNNKPERPDADHGESRPQYSSPRDNQPNGRPREDRVAPAPENGRYADRNNQPERPITDRGEPNPQPNDRSREDRVAPAPENRGRYADRNNQPERPNTNRGGRPQYVPKDNQSNDRPAPERRSEPRVQTVSAPSYERKERSSSSNSGSSQETYGRARSNDSNGSRGRSKSDNSSASNESKGPSRSRN